MSIFSSILDKLGIHKKEEAAAKPAAPAAPVTPAAPAAPQGYGHMPPSGPPPAPHATPYYTPGGNVPSAPVTPTSVTPAEAAAAAAAAVKPAEMAMVDVTSHLDALAKASPIPLNWKVSINDLMALLGLDHSPQAIKDLAVELGCPEKEMADSYSRNVWTHQALLKKIAENGGNIPPELLK